MAAQLNVIGIVVSDMAESLRFYRTLGVHIDDVPEGEDHVEAISGGMRLAWDTQEMIAGILGAWEEPRGHRIEIAFKCDDASGVDAVYSAVVAAGFGGTKTPWDAFWGQRYAILADPDGNHVSLFA
jgi:catechol 2,3-dioxygenase-like lactoylglutathione lyase family enzyme